jgi:hypothetical protein
MAPPSSTKEEDDADSPDTKRSAVKAYLDDDEPTHSNEGSTTSAKKHRNDKASEQEDELIDTKQPSGVVSIESPRRESSPMTKSPRSDDDCENNPSGEILDLATTFGFQAGDRFEVQWTVESPAGDDTRWWGATLIAHDGRTSDDSVAIRVLDYDPYPEGGFTERSREDVIFIGKEVLINPESMEELTYRLAGEEQNTVWMPRGQAEDVVNEILTRALEKNSRAFSEMTPARQAVIAEAIATKKEKLVELLENHERRFITSNDMQAILARTMQE